MNDANPKKIILVIADTMTINSIGVYGKNPTSTPNIDNLGKKGVIFLNTYTTITKTDPAITSIMSGNYPATNGLVNIGTHIREEEYENVKKIKLLPEIIKLNGYKTIAIDWMSRWHQRGYDYYSNKLVSDERSDYIVIDKLPAIQNLSRRLDIAAIKLFKKPFLTRFYYCFYKNPSIPYDKAEVVVDKAIEELEKNKKYPIFLYIHLWDPHWPYTRPTGLKSFIVDDIIKAYLAEIRYLDAQIGRLTDFLNAANLLNETLIILTSDHGENFHEHDLPSHHENLYEDVVRVPLIITYGRFMPKKINALVQNMDIYPTIMDILKLKYPHGLDGKSLVPLLTGKASKIHDFVFFEDLIHKSIHFLRSVRRRAIRRDNNKYIQTLEGNDKKLNGIVPLEDTKIIKEELYDLKNDPFEKENLIHKQPSVANQLRKQLYSKILELNVKRLQNNPSLYDKFAKSLKIIKNTVDKFDAKEVAVAWTGGKDSTVLLHLVRMAFDGKIPFKVIFNDSTMEFAEIYEFINRISKLWNIKLITIKHSEKELKEFHATGDRERKKELSRLMKITAINTALKKYKLKALMAAIRWDEHESRSKEKYFSPRPDHMRIHPILHFTEKDIWEYIKHFGVPYVSLYDKGYRSLGEKPFTKPVPPGGSERSGRERDKEQLMQRLRKMGYW